MSPNFQNGKALTSQDIDNLIKSPAEKRMDITQKVAQLYTAGGFSGDQMKIADQLFRVLIKDTEVEVRKTLAEAIKDSTGVPHDVIKDLAKDIEDIALPVLQFSEVLSDEDLIEIIESTEDPKKQIAVSKRDKVSSSVSGALINTNNEEVVDTLLHNENAEVSEESYAKIVENFSDKQNIMETMIEREALPVTVVEHLAKTISNAIYEQLSDKNKEAFGNLSEVVEKSSDVATMKVLGLKTTEQQYYHFLGLMRKLQVSDNLIPISALCMGNMNIFEVSMAKHMKIPVINVKTLMEDENNKGFKALYERAHLPSNLYEATELLLTVLREFGNKLESERPGIAISEELSNRIIESVMEKAEEQGHVENLDYIISLIRHNAAIGKEDKKA